MTQDTEIHDNVTAYWVPKQRVERGQRLEVAYRLLSLMEPGPRPPLDRAPAPPASPAWTGPAILPAAAVEATKAVPSTNRRAIPRRRGLRLVFIGLTDRLNMTAPLERLRRVRYACRLRTLACEPRTEASPGKRQPGPHEHGAAC